MREIMLKSDAGKKAAEDFGKLYEKDKAMIQKREEEMKKLKDDLEKQRSVLTESCHEGKRGGIPEKIQGLPVDGQGCQ